MGKLEQTISLSNLELNLMLAVAKQRYTSVSEEETFDLDAIDIGLELGNQKIKLSPAVTDILEQIKLLDESVYEAFLYAYNGAIRA